MNIERCVSLSTTSFVAGAPSLRTAFFLAALLSTALPPTIALAATAQSNLAIRVTSPTRLGGSILPVDHVMRALTGRWPPPHGSTDPRHHRLRPHQRRASVL